MGVAQAQPRGQRCLEFARGPAAVAHPVKPVTHEHPRLEHLLHLGALLRSNDLKSWHKVLTALRAKSS